MGNLQGYNANEWEPNVAFEPVPAGTYTAIIADSAMEATKAGDGQFLKLDLQIVEGPHEGRRLFDRLNLENRNETAVEIARRTLSAICRAVGKMTPSDSSELHNIPLQITVTIEPRKDTGEPSNRIKGYKPVDGRASDPGVKPAANPGKKPPPWGKRK